MFNPENKLPFQGRYYYHPYFTDEEPGTLKPVVIGYKHILWLQNHFFLLLN